MKGAGPGRLDEKFLQPVRGGGCRATAAARAGALRGSGSSGRRRGVLAPGSEAAGSGMDAGSGGAAGGPQHLHDHLRSTTTEPQPTCSGRLQMPTDMAASYRKNHSRNMTFTTIETHQQHSDFLAQPWPHITREDSSHKLLQKPPSSQSSHTEGQRISLHRGTKNFTPTSPLPPPLL
jgi:hypothetical protein